MMIQSILHYSIKIQGCPAFQENISGNFNNVNRKSNFQSRGARLEFRFATNSRIGLQS